MKVPKKIKLMNRDIRVIKFKPEEAKDHGVFGFAIYSQGLIRYLDGSDKAEVADTIIHELLHHIERQMDIFPEDIDKKLSERIVRGFATGIATVMRDNPKLMKQLQALIERGHVDD